jgi:hypothetical protein
LPKKKRLLNVQEPHVLPRLQPTKLPQTRLQRKSALPLKKHVLPQPLLLRLTWRLWFAKNQFSTRAYPIDQLA